MSFVYYMSDRYDFARLIKNISSYVEKTNCYDNCYHDMELSLAARVLASEKGFRNAYFEHFPDRSEEDLNNSARDHIRVNRVMYRLEMDRQLTREELDGPCMVVA